MVLLVGFYQDALPERTEELIECLRRNTDNEFIDAITVFIEDSTTPADARARFRAFEHVKVRLLTHGRRLTYAHLFDYANRAFAGARVVIANADIFFDATLGLLEGERLAGHMLCLSRWECAADGTLQHFDRSDSQDAWILEPPLPRIAADFCLGKPGCDNRLAYEAERAGLVLSNPSRSVRACHLHRTGVRRYTQQDRLFGPTRMVQATLLDAPAPPQLSRPSLQSFPSHRGLRFEALVKEHYREIEPLLAHHLGGVVPGRLRRELLRALTAGMQGPSLPTGGPLAAVAFRESMGYTLARLEPGASTHNNQSRPLVFVPAELTGLQFTQVVANHATPVEIEFRTTGRLFVLAAPGWEGYGPAAAFLDDAGWREPVEPLRAKEGTVFEPWSLLAQAGERLRVPTQVMLASSELLRVGS